jgi:hypothetical protein
MFREQLGHADWSCAIVTLRGAFLSSGVVQGTGDLNELPLEVEATDFQGGNFAYAEAAHRGDEEHEFVGVHRGIDDSRGGVSVEEKDLRLGFFVSREHDVSLFHVWNRVTPLSSQVQNRAQGAIDVFGGFPPIDTLADCGYEGLVLAEIHLTQGKLAKLRKNVCPNVRQGRTRSPRFSIRKYFVGPLCDERSD